MDIIGVISALACAALVQVLSSTFFVIKILMFYEFSDLWALKLMLL